MHQPRTSCQHTACDEAQHTTHSLRPTLTGRCWQSSTAQRTARIGIVFT
jgi:hypothetical protein